MSWVWPDERASHLGPFLTTSCDLANSSNPAAADHGHPPTPVLRSSLAGNRPALRIVAAASCRDCLGRIAGNGTRGLSSFYCISSKYWWANASITRLTRNGRG
ncbi:hypothetical protein IF1G_02827 [Cordyceps javanica]|uniref:Uncharacterized protein n=1 Tax=Cordyceps javanica TaxID=43265 RepID=A0A545VAI7_9HYPO|nr:hypothetical protein IF1G_02827 [Cordyceps javanica]